MDVLSTKPIDNANQVLEEARKAFEKVDDLLEKLAKENLVGQSAPEEPEQDDQVEELLQQDRVFQWVLWNDLIDQLGSQCIQIFEEGHFGPTLKLLENLDEISQKLEKSKCDNLKKRTKLLLKGICQKVKEDLSVQMEQDLTKLNYPTCIVNEKVSIGQLNLETDKNLHQFKMKFLLGIKVGLLLTPEGACDPVWSPNEFLFSPLKKRFRFHFCGKKKTNNVVRPEWFLQQVKIWMKNSHNFYESFLLGATRIQGDPEMVRQQHLSLCKGLLKLVRHKLATDMKDLVEDDVLLGHFLDEILIFTKDVHDMGCAKQLPLSELPIVVIEEEDIFKRWLAIERKYAFEKIDGSLRSEEGWQQSPANPEIFRCTETFVTLLQGLTARFKFISADKKLIFLEMQCQLIEDFRMRLVQMIRQEQSLPISDKFALGLNSAHYVVAMLETWTEMPLFMHLTYLLQSSDSSHQGAFCKEIDGLNYFKKDSVKNLAVAILYEVKAKSYAYKNLNWVNFKGVGDESPCVESLALFQKLAAHLNTITLKLNRELSAQAVDFLQYELAEFYIQEIVIQNLFNPAGAEQLQIDVTQGLFPVLSQYLKTAGSGLNMPRLEETLKLLVMNAANATLVRDSLIDCGLYDTNRIKEILNEMEIKHLSGSFANKILSKRTDLL